MLYFQKPVLEKYPPYPHGNKRIFHGLDFGHFSPVIGYAEHIAEVGDAEPRLRRIDRDTAELPISVARPVTKYERKALAGPIVTELLWERIP